VSTVLYCTVRKGTLPHLTLLATFTASLYCSPWEKEGRGLARGAAGRFLSCRPVGLSLYWTGLDWTGLNCT